MTFCYDFTMQYIQWSTRTKTSEVNKLSYGTTDNLDHAMLLLKQKGIV
jgi:hypothetical protein